jgi:hypothetical protein
MGGIIGSYFTAGAFDIKVYDDGYTFLSYGEGTVAFRFDDESTDYIISVCVDIGHLLKTLAKSTPPVTHEYEKMWTKSFLDKANIKYKVVGNAIICRQLCDFLKIKGKPDKNIDLGRWSPIQGIGATNA